MPADETLSDYENWISSFADNSPFGDDSIFSKKFRAREEEERRASEEQRQRKKEEAKANYGAETSNWVRIKQIGNSFLFRWHDKSLSQNGFEEYYGSSEVTLWDIKQEVYFKDEKGEEFLYLLQGNGDVKQKKINDGTTTLVLLVEKKNIFGMGHLPIKISGYFDGIIEDTVHKVDVRIDVKVWYMLHNITANEKSNLHFIQFVYSNKLPNPDDPKEKSLGKVNVEDKFEDEAKTKPIEVMAFVDSGKNSQKHGDVPWYKESLSEEGLRQKDARGKFDLNPIDKLKSIRFKLSDQPGYITKDYAEVLNFETYLVIDNYNGNGKIKILAAVSWGFKKSMGAPTDGGANPITKTIETPTMTVVSQFSPYAQRIWDNDYGKNNVDTDKGKYVIYE